ncbi:hypothetical protein [Actinoplanes sp. NPDC020271]|uniref:hypothetical protein n=1 Tax=Actinoplanes sp. NPDC020271 TaxID=3363896 RepID=UPI00378EE9B1
MPGGSGRPDQGAGEDGNDVLYGGNGSDRVSGYAGNDYLYGGNGSDTLIGGLGRDRIHGGAGKDKITRDPGVPRRSLDEWGPHPLRILAKARPMTASSSSSR